LAARSLARPHELDAMAKQIAANRAIDVMGSGAFEEFSTREIVT
jgi:hypothetical protein